MKLGIYRHFKGKNYRVYGEVLNAVTDKVEVIYRALYGEYNFYAREKDNFCEIVNREGYDQKERLVCINHKAYLFTHQPERGNVYTNEVATFIGSLITKFTTEELQMGYEFYLRAPIEEDGVLVTYLCKPFKTLVKITMELDGTFKGYEFMEESIELINDPENVGKDIEQTFNNHVLCFEGKLPL